jgi:imidazolonepropionase-like amidohydrolase
VSPDFAAVADRLPPLVRRGFLGGGLPVTEGGADRYRASFKKMQQIVLEAWKRGIRIVPGTDSLAGFSLHRELELYAEAGIPNLDVLSMATLGAAQIAGRAAVSGSIRQGKLADLVLVAGAPDRRMRDIRNVDTVIKGGSVLDPAAIDRVLGVKPATAAPR